MPADPGGLLEFLNVSRRILRGGLLPGGMLQRRGKASLRTVPGF